MQPMRTPLKTELGLVAAKMLSRRARQAAAAAALPRNARLVVRIFMFMLSPKRGFNWAARSLRPHTRENQRRNMDILPLGGGGLTLKPFSACCNAIRLKGKCQGGELNSRPRAYESPA